MNKSVAIGNKLYIIGDEEVGCEVYDSICNKFILLKAPTEESLWILENPREAISIGNKILVFDDHFGEVLIYDVVSDEWSKESCGSLKNLSFYSCVTIPHLMVKSD